MSNKIVVIGSANTDMTIKSDKFPEPGETILGGDFYMNPGGKGANQAVAAARLGGTVEFIVRLGNDTFGQHAIASYSDEGISTDNIIIDNGNHTGVALISVNGDGENKIIVAPGANACFTEKDIESSKKLISEADLILLQLEIPLETIGLILEEAKRCKTRVVLNPAPAQSLPEWHYKDLFLITPNESETERLTGIAVKDEDSAKAASKWFHDAGVQNVVITLGKNGAFVSSLEYAGFVNAPKMKVVDTTGAGDVFNGALVVALAQNKSWKESVNFACSAAALSVTKIGAQSSSPSLDELNTFLEKLSETEKL